LAADEASRFYQLLQTGLEEVLVWWSRRLIPALQSAHDLLWNATNC